MSPRSATAFVGRSRELDQLRAAVGQAADAASGGAGGGLWFLRGEPGIGKSRLSEELALQASDMGLDVVWGRCWEGGGAPAFWPFIQVLRAVLRDLPDALLSEHAPHLSQLLPELAVRHGGEGEGAAADPERARFMLMDSVAALLGEAARFRPRLILLEDLHSADPSSVTLLDFLESATRGAPLLIVGTYRDADAARAPIGPVLERLAARAHTLALSRLSRQEVAEYLTVQSGAVPAAALVDEVYRATEGHALFLVETARLLSSRSSVQGTGVVVPRSVKNAIRERLMELSPEVREVLRAASVMGRDVSRELLSTLTGQPTGELAVPLAEAADAAVIHEIAPGHYRFGHVLTREVLHDDLVPERREALHAALAAALAARDGDAVSWSALSHHYLQAGCDARQAALDALGRAARQALDQLAPEQAVEHFDRALALSTELKSSEADRFELLLGSGRALQLAGAVEGGRERCLSALSLARDARQPTWLARAALAYGALLRFAHVDETLVTLLQEADAALGDEPSALKARVMARLSAAMQPQVPPEPPMELARRAIAMARQVADDPALLDVLRDGCSTMIDLGDPEERLALNGEQALLAEKLGNGVEQLRAYTRSVFDCYELGDLVGARGAIERAAVLAERLDHPYYRWRVVASKVTEAAHRGHLDEAERLLAEARRLADASHDANAEAALAHLKAFVLELRGDHEALYAHLPVLERSLSGSPFMDTIMHLYVAGYLAHMRRDADARARRIHAAVEDALQLGDVSSLWALSEMARALGDTELATRVLERLGDHPERLQHGGMIAMTWNAPVSAALARLECVRGEHERAFQLYEQALAQCARVGARPHEGWIALEYARELSRKGADGERQRSLCARAAQLSEELGLGAMANAAAAIGQPGAPASSRSGPPSATEPLMLEPEGELWALSRGDTRLLVKDTKGMRILARLLSEPGREFHVLDLSGAGGAADGGDAGEVIDAQARDAYRARVVELRETLEQAEADNDLARAERAREELDALSRELSRAVGLGNRVRRSGSAVERARVNVQRRLRDAVKRIERQDGAIGRHLDRSVKTGTFCSYDPG